MEELKVGEEIRIKCVEDYNHMPDCSKCYFHGCSSPYQMKCVSYARTDDMNVHFELVEE